MLLKFSVKPETGPDTMLSGRFGNLFYSGHLDPIEYNIDTQHFTFLIDTNLTKDRKLELKMALEKVEIIDIQSIQDLLHGNYFLIALEKASGRIHLLRDPSGIKTAYFWKEGETCMVSTVMHQIALQLEQVEFCKEAVHQLLYSGYLLDGYTLYEGIKELQMGHHMILDQNLNATTGPSLNLNLALEDNNYTPQENFTGLREESLRAHQGYMGRYNRVLLSGGLDSIAMLISLDDLIDGEEQKLNALSFKVKDTLQDETVYARSITQHLEIPQQILQIDPDNEAIIKDFEDKVLQMNNPYFGAWIFGQLNASPYEMYYAGQDTRLHTPALNEIDKWAIAFLPHRDKWWLRKVLTPLSKALGGFMKTLKWHKSSNRLVKNLFKLTQIFDLKAYLDKFYLKLDKEKIAKNGLPIDYYDEYARHFQYELADHPNPRALYNQIVRLKWKEQYVYDIRYLQDVARMNKTYIAMPFYNKKIAEFSSGIPFRLATKLMIGRARFGKKKAIVYKYALRRAFKDKLNDLTYYRAKAVSQTLHQLFNGPLGQKVEGLLKEDLDFEDSFVKQFRLEGYVGKYFDQRSWKEADVDYLQTLYYIATLIVYHRRVVVPAKMKRQLTAKAR